MSKYIRPDIDALCERLETRADGIVNHQPAFAGDVRAAVLLLRLMSALANASSSLAEEMSAVEHGGGSDNQ